MDTPTCYICMEEESSTNPFLTTAMCDCSSKPDSSLKVHQLCFELARDATNLCHVCKRDVGENWAFDRSRWRMGQDEDTVTWYSYDFQLRENHGPFYTLGRTYKYTGPVRYLAAKGDFQDDLQHGTFEVYAPDGTTISRATYDRDQLLSQQDFASDGSVVAEMHYKAAGIKHGLCRRLHEGIWMGGAFVDGKRIGIHNVLLDSVRYGPWDVKEVGIYETANYVDGKRQGLVRRIYLDEQEPFFEGHYVDDVADGLQRTLRKNSSSGNWHLVSEWHMKAGVKHGVEINYSGGEPQETIHWCDGKMHGLRELNMGNVKLLENYKDGVLHGPTRRYEDGKLVMDAVYVDGLRSGRHTYFDGVRRVQADYVIRGGVELLHGRAEIYHERQKMRKLANYKFGVRHGRKQIFVDDVLRFDLNYKDGRLDGRCVAYTGCWTVGCKAPHIQAEAHFIDGIPHGRFRLWSTDGILQEEGSYVDGQLHGPVNYYDYDGKPLQRLRFDGGRLAGLQRIEGLTFKVRDGLVHGPVRRLDERLAEHVEYVEGVGVAEVLGGTALRVPSELRGYLRRFTSLHYAATSIKL